MKHSLHLTPHQVQELFRLIQGGLHDKTPLKLAYKNVIDQPALKLEEITYNRINEHIEFIVSRGAKPPDTYLLLGMISNLVREKFLDYEFLNEEIRKIFAPQDNTIQPGKLIISNDGTWIVEWLLDDDTYLSALKYDPQVGEIVPEPIIEILQSVFMCLEKEAYIAALSLALMALETTLWDHLSIKNITKKQVITRYPHKVTACLEWDGGKYSFLLKDHNEGAKVPANPVKLEFEIYRTSRVKNGADRTLELVIDDDFSDLLSSGDDPEEKEKEVAGLNEALQRARKENLIKTWENYLDESFRVLRNNLVHRSTDYENIEVQIPFGVVRLGEFAKNRNLDLLFLRRIIAYISDAYLELSIEQINNHK